jgi:hypothetical protein
MQTDVSMFPSLWEPTPVVTMRKKKNIVLTLTSVHSRPEGSTVQGIGVQIANSIEIRSGSVDILINYL